MQQQPNNTISLRTIRLEEKDRALCHLLDTNPQ